MITLLFLTLFDAKAFETCTERNDYLEKLLPEVIDDAPASPLPAACIEASHLSLAPTGYYGFCPTSEGAPSRSHPRPCVSRRYVGAIHAALVNVADCLGFDPRDAFATFNLESATHMVAVGAATDVGIGQLTKSAIDEVTLNALDKARRIATASPKDSCRRILPFMTSHPSEREKRCGFMSVPENPTRNLVYSILLIQQNRKIIERYWSRLNVQLPATVDAERVKERLTFLAYNAGAAGGVAALKAYADIMGDRVNERLLNFDSKDFYGFPNYMNRFFPTPTGKESYRKRIAKYIFYVAQAARRVERLAGMACFDPATFPLVDFNQPVVFKTNPNFAHAEQLTQTITDYLAMTFKDEHSDLKDCAALRAQFKTEFLGQGMSEADFTGKQKVAYEALCE